MIKKFYLSSIKGTFVKTENNFVIILINESQEAHVKE